MSGSLALMPSYTFAATAHAAIWTGLTPVFCDVDPETWLPSPASEEQLLRTYGSRIAVIVPYATFGACLDIERYEELARRHSAGLVIDAAASLGTRDVKGRGFGTGSRYAVVYSMHATKTFATGEAGVVYSANTDLIERLRTMANFGFGKARHATMPGLNAKLPEVGALLASLRLNQFDEIVESRLALYDRYREKLSNFEFQAPTSARQAHQFVPLLVPRPLAARRGAIIASLATAGISTANYFSPHLAQQSYFQDTCEIGPLPNTDDVSARSLSLPLSDVMTVDQVDYVCEALLSAV